MCPYVNIFVQPLALRWIDNWEVYTNDKILIMRILKLFADAIYSANLYDLKRRVHLTEILFLFKFFI